MSIKKDTVAKYVRFLANLGCVFKVIEEDGTEHGTLRTEVPKKRTPRANVIGAIDYKSPIRKLGVGDVAELPVPDSIAPVSLQSAVSGFCATTFGAGKFTSSYNRSTNMLEVMRLDN